MALKVLLKRKELDGLNRQLEQLRAMAAEFEAREADLVTAISEAETDEERAVVENAVAEFEADKETNGAEIAQLEARVSEIEAEIEALERAQDAPVEEKPVERKDEIPMRIESKKNIFTAMPDQRREALFAQDDVRNFMATVRQHMAEKRAITNAGLLIPTNFLGLIRENIERYSKLYRHVNARQIGGNGTMVVMGTIPEAVWTDCCGILNELELSFNDAEVACWKVGGYFDICNATLEDSDIDLASELLAAIGAGIGRALDKAILFGLGTRMPLGIFTRLAQESEPGDYPATARPWVDLTSTNIQTIADTVTGIDLFRAFLVASANAKGAYSRGQKVWAMNETTYTTLIASAMAIDGAGAIVAGVNGTMPVIGGLIEVLDFIPDNLILGGYFDLYLLAERAGTRLDSSEHYRFVEDRTVFRGTARYDGLPVIPEAFVAIGINGVTPDASDVTFAPDTANSDASE